MRRKLELTNRDDKTANDEPAALNRVWIFPYLSCSCNERVVRYGKEIVDISHVCSFPLLFLMLPVPRVTVLLASLGVSSSNVLFSICYFLDVQRVPLLLRLRGVIAPPNIAEPICSCLSL